MTRRTAQGSAVVIGATGHLGQAVARELASHGYDVTGIGRNRTTIAPPGVRMTLGDVARPGFLEHHLAADTLVVDAAAPHPLSVFVADSPDEINALDRAAQRIRCLLNAIAARNARLVFVSSFTTLPRPEASGLSGLEAQWRRGIYPYFRVKALMEQMVLDAARTGAPIAVVNPAAFLGPWDTKPVESSFAQMVMARRLPNVVPHVINVVDVRDVAVAIRVVAESRRDGGPIPLAGYNIAVDELARRIASEARVPPPAVVVDTRVAAIGAFWSEIAWAASGRSAPHAIRAMPLIADSWPMQPSAEQRALGATPRPLDETIRDTVRWHSETSGHG